MAWLAHSDARRTRHRKVWRPRAGRQSPGSFRLARLSLDPPRTGVGTGGSIATKHQAPPRRASARGGWSGPSPRANRAAFRQGAYRRRRPWHRGARLFGDARCHPSSAGANAPSRLGRCRDVDLIVVDEAHAPVPPRGDASSMPLLRRAFSALPRRRSVSTERAQASARRAARPPHPWTLRGVSQSASSGLCRRRSCARRCA